MKWRTKFHPSYSGLVRDVCKCAIPVVVVQNVAPVLGDVEIREAIVVVVSPHAAQAITRTRNASGLRDVSESAITIILVKSVAHRDPTIVKVTAVHEINGWVSVTIEIRDAHARTEQLPVNGNAIVAPKMDKVDSSGLRYVRELYGIGRGLPVRIFSRTGSRESPR